MLSSMDGSISSSHCPKSRRNCSIASVRRSMAFSPIVGREP
jgi:hypothetical protein